MTDEEHNHLKALGATVRLGSGPEALIWIVAFIDAITESDDEESTALLTQAIEHIGDRLDDGPDDRCTDPGGHKFECTGTAYGGEDPRWHGEGRSLCIHCGADGDA